MYTLHSPFLRPDDPRYPEMLTDAAVIVLGDCGVDRLSVGSLARWLNVTPAAVLKEYSRARVIELVVATFGNRWLDWSDPGPFRAFTTRLPQTADEVHGVRIHRALSELVRGELVAGRVEPSRIWSEVRRDELHMLQRRLGATEHDAEQMLALATGLRLALADPEPTLTYETAAEILEARAADLRLRAG
jgi:hypothetical protein